MSGVDVLCATQVPLDSPRAHAINAVKTSGGFARLNLRVHLASGEPLDADPATALRDLHEEGLPCTLWPAVIHANPWRTQNAFGEWFAGLVSRLRPKVVYARHFSGAMRARELGVPTIMETHAHINAENPLLDASLLATREPGAPLWITTISHRLRAHYIERGADADRVFVTPDGVDIDLFTPPDDFAKEQGPPRVVYAGHLYDWKGVPEILDASELLPGVRFEIVGGLDEDIERVRGVVTDRGLSNVRVVGRVAHREVPRLLWGADALVLAPSAREPSKDWTSPVKLGEYLASGSPVIASDIPALRDWLDDDTALWCRPDDPVSLAGAIERAIATPDTPARRLARAAMAHRLSYANRARAMLLASGVLAPPEGSGLDEDPRRADMVGV